MQQQEETKEENPAQETPQQAPQQEDIDSRSIYVGNVDYSASSLELRDFFQDCGGIVRVTIPLGHNNGPKGYAYIEFNHINSVHLAQSFNDKVFKGRKLKVLPKRTNIPGKGKKFPGRGGSNRGPRNKSRRGRKGKFY